MTAMVESRGALRGITRKATAPPQCVTTPCRSSYAVAVSPAILIKEGPLAGQRVELNGELVIGRENASLTLEDPELSRRHAVIRPVEDGAEIEDLGSLNGTLVNERRIEVPTRVTGSDTIRLGTTVLVIEAAMPSATVVSQAPSAPPAATPPVATPTAAAPTPATPPAAAPPAAAAAPPAAADAPGSGIIPAEPFGTYAAPAATGKRRGIASRQLMPLLLSWAAVAGTAVALAIYFSQH